MRFPSFPFQQPTVIPEIWRTSHTEKAARKREYDTNALQEHSHLTLQTLLRQAYDTVPFYHGLWDRHGVSFKQLTCVDALSCLPLVSKADFQWQPHIQWMSTIPRKAWPVLSSGTTTGARRFALRDANADIANSLTIRRYLRAYRISPGDTVVFLHAGERKPIYKELRWREWGIRRIHIHVLDLVESPEWMASAHVIAGPASQLEYVATRYTETGIQPPKLFVNYAERMSPAARMRLTALLETPITDIYCASELSTLIGFTCSHNTGFHLNTDFLRVEVLNEHGVPCQLGERGEVVVTDLMNFVTPLIRYRLGDIVKLGEANPCPCGRALPTLVEQVEGRVGEEIIFEGNIFPVFPLIEYLETRGVRQFTLMQASSTAFVLRVYVSDGSSLPMTNREFQNILQVYLGGAIKANVQAVSFQMLLQSPSKMRPFISQLKRHNI